MLAQRLGLPGIISVGTVGFLLGVFMTAFCVCLSMTGENPLVVSVQGRAGKIRAVEIDGTVYRLIEASRYAELSRCEWMVRHGR